MDHRICMGYGRQSNSVFVGPSLAVTNIRYPPPARPLSTLMIRIPRCTRCTGTAPYCSRPSTPSRSPSGLYSWRERSGAPRMYRCLRSCGGRRRARRTRRRSTRGGRRPGAVVEGGRMKVRCGPYEDQTARYFALLQLYGRSSRIFIRQLGSLATPANAANGRH